MNSDEILTRIIELEEIQTQLRSEYEEMKGQTREKEIRKDELRIAYEEIKDLYTKASKEWESVKYSLDINTKQGLDNKEELARLKREYSRIQDAELIHQEYLDKVQAFRESCLEATWRKENRSDGLGAFTHQIEGAIHLAVNKQALLGDKRGIGKSLTSIIWLDLIEAKKVIVLSPSDTMDNFIREVKLWAPHRSCIKLGKLDRGIRDVLLEQLKFVSEFLIVINYEAWRKDKDLINDLVALKADTLICDEAHRAKNLSTITCQGVLDLRFGTNICPSCRSLADGCSIRTFERNPNKAVCNDCGHEGFITDFCSIRYVLPMTGTPILNKPQELFPHLRLINPKDFTTENLFLRDFCMKNSQGRWKWQWNAEREVMKKIGPRYLARDRKSAGVIIPPPTPVDHIITMDELAELYPKQYRAYAQCKNYAQIVLDPNRKIAMSMPVFLTVILRLRQVLTWPAAIELKLNDPDTEDVEVIRLDVHESAKVDKAEELIREINEEGERVVLFSQFKAPLEELQRRLGNNTCIYDGNTNSYRRNEIQLDFDPKTTPQIPRWMNVLCNYKAAGEGLNLNSATHMVILDKEWNPGRQDQAYGRIDRIGQTKETMIHTVKVEPSIDTWMENLIQEKAELIGGFEVQADIAQKMYDSLRNGEI